MKQALFTLLSMSVSGGILAAIVFLVRALVQKRISKAVLPLLWALVGLRLVLPLTLAVSFSPFPALGTGTSSNVSATNVRIETGFEETALVSGDAVQASQGTSATVNPNPGTTSPVPGNTSTPVSENPNARTGNTPATTVTNPANSAAANPLQANTPVAAEAVVPVSSKVSESAATAASLPDILFGVWIAGVLGMLVYFFVSYLQLKRRTRDAVSAGGDIYHSNRLFFPFVLGIVRPKVFLPKGLNDDETRQVLAHERAHIERLDHVTKPLAFLVLAIHWFNPLVWLAYFSLSRDIEFACDERAVRGFDAGARKEYGETLLRLSTKRASIQPSLLSFGEVGVKARLKMLFKKQKVSLLLTVLAMVLTLVLEACLFTTKPTESTEPTEASPVITEYTAEEANVVTKELYTWDYSSELKNYRGYHEFLGETDGLQYFHAYDLQDGSPILLQRKKNPENDNSIFTSWADFGMDGKSLIRFFPVSGTKVYGIWADDEAHYLVEIVPGSSTKVLAKISLPKGSLGASSALIGDWAFLPFTTETTSSLILVNTSTGEVLTLMQTENAGAASPATWGACPAIDPDADPNKKGFCFAEYPDRTAGTGSAVYCFDPETKTAKLLLHSPRKLISACGTPDRFFGFFEGGFEVFTTKDQQTTCDQVLYPSGQAGLIPRSVRKNGDVYAIESFRGKAETDGTGNMTAVYNSGKKEAALYLSDASEWISTAFLNGDGNAVVVCQNSGVRFLDLEAAPDDPDSYLGANVVFDGVVIPDDARAWLVEYLTLLRNGANIRENERIGDAVKDNWTALSRWIKIGWMADEYRVSEKYYEASDRLALRVTAIFGSPEAGAYAEYVYGIILRLVNGRWTTDENAESYGDRTPFLEKIIRWDREDKGPIPAETIEQGKQLAFEYIMSLRDEEWQETWRNFYSVTYDEALSDANLAGVIDACEVFEAASARAFLVTVNVEYQGDSIPQEVYSELAFGIPNVTMLVYEKDGKMETLVSSRFDIRPLEQKGLAAFRMRVQQVLGAVNKLYFNASSYPNLKLSYKEANSNKETIYELPSLLPENENLWPAELKAALRDFLESALELNVYEVYRWSAQYWNRQKAIGLTDETGTWGITVLQDDPYQIEHIIIQSRNDVYVLSVDLNYREETEDGFSLWNSVYRSAEDLLEEAKAHIKAK